MNAKLIPGNHGEGCVVCVVGYGEVLAVVDLRSIHGGKGAGHFSRRQNFEGVADRWNKVVEQLDIQSSAQGGRTGDVEHVELARTGAGDVSIQRTRGGLGVGAGDPELARCG